jgi:hypothetical protein
VIKRLSRLFLYGLCFVAGTGSLTLTSAGWFSSAVSSKTAPAVVSEPAIKAEPATGRALSQTVFLIPNSADDPKALSAFLAAHADLKITLLFPPNYFERAERKPFMKHFQTLASTGQIEIGLTLDNQPMLPLLADLSIAGAPKWNFSFARPDDVAAQIARASAAYQRHWGALPSGLLPPYFALSEAVVDTLKRFRLSWTISAPSVTPGVRFYGSVAVITPPIMPTWEVKDARGWANQASAWTLTQPVTLVDATQQTDPQADLRFLEALAKKHAGTPTTLSTAQELVSTIPEYATLPKDPELFHYDYTNWVASPQQKKAWSALADAHEALDAYQSSGRANLQRLDAAVEEMCSAESGPFLLELNGSVQMEAERERSFSATLANVYRLCEKPVPTTLNIWFGGRSWQKTGSATKSSQQEGPFFSALSQNFTWNDPKGDDNGAGAYVYPVGPYPKGMFDLKTVNIQWDESNIHITVSVVDAFSRKKLPIVPLADIYIDVNKLADAGSTDGLSRRGNLTVEREAAWEYAVSMSPLKAVLYQSVPGSSARALDNVSVTNAERSWTATFPRTKLRGDPKRWRLSVALMGTENSPQAIEPAPVTFRNEATERNFGGAPKSRVSPVIDLLAPSSDDQTTVITVNVNGGPLTLPYVDAQ